MSLYERASPREAVETPRGTTFSMRDAVHIWVIPIQYDRERVRNYLSWLDSEELECARRFRFARDRALYVESHLWLRRLLSDASGEHPAAVRFERAPGQKPALSGLSIQFNLSHTHHYAAVALTRAGPVGIDIERIRPIEQIEDVGRLVWHSEEREWLQALSSDARRTAFFRLWTAKEAYAKALGYGLSMQFDRLRVSPVDDHRHLITDEGSATPVTGACHYSCAIGERPDSDYVLSVSVLCARVPVVIRRVPRVTDVTDPLEEITPLWISSGRVDDESRFGSTTNKPTST